nr:HlyD family secretion protein [Candidatus Cloacimonadota bacterium]
MKKYIKYIVILLVIVVAIIIINNYRKSKKAPEWRTMTPTMGSVREVVTSTGALNPYILVNVGTEVSGKIEKIYKDYNDTVKRGDLLAKLDTEILATALEAARGDLNKAIIAQQEAELDYNLLVELLDQEMTPEYDVNKARFRLETAIQNVENSRLSLQRAEKNLANAHITSPIDGVIVSRDVDEGQTVAASLNSPTLFIIANNLDKMQITAGVDEADIGKIKLDLPVEFSVDAYPSERFFGTVQQVRLNPRNESNVVTYDVIIDANNPDGKLLPGMTTNATFIINAKENVLRVPEAATRFRPSKEVWELFGLEWNDDILAAGRNAMRELMGTSNPQTSAANADKGGKMQQDRRANTNPGRVALVWVLRDGVPTAKAIRVGVSDGAFVELVEGLEEDDVLITGVIYKDPKQAAAGSPNMRMF